MNASWYRQWCSDQGMTMITGRDVYKRGMEACILEALGIAGDGTDLIYVSVDIDASPTRGLGTSASSPEGLSAWDLLEAMFICGQHPKVAAPGRCRNRPHARCSGPHRAGGLLDDTGLPGRPPAPDEREPRVLK